LPFALLFGLKREIIGSEAAVELGWACQSAWPGNRMTLNLLKLGGWLAAGGEYISEGEGLATGYRQIIGK